ncbi:hypothetical protein BVY03_05995, partial [bacterium K02(2017)]
MRPIQPLKIHFLLLIYLTFILQACASHSSKNRQIRVLSYNIHAGYGIDKKLNLKRIAKIIKKQKADIVALQEVDKKTKRSNFKNQAQLLAKATKMNFTFGKSMPFNDGEYGNAILSLA